MNFMVFVFILILLMTIAALYRIMRGPTVWDRLLGFSFFSAKIIILAICIGVIIDRTYMVDIALIYGVLGFVGIIMLARFLERKGDI